jgi:hypothetical protein
VATLLSSIGKFACGDLAAQAVLPAAKGATFAACIGVSQPCEPALEPSFSTDTHPLCGT